MLNRQASIFCSSMLEEFSFSDHLSEMSQQYDLNQAIYQVGQNSLSFAQILNYFVDPSYQRGSLSRISDLHVKDRKLNGASVYLGQGDAQIPEFFKEFQKYDFKGPIIMQLLRDEEGVTVFKQQFEKFLKLVKPYLQ